jgi:hypothetical protein
MFDNAIPKISFPRKVKKPLERNTRGWRKEVRQD